MTGPASSKKTVHIALEVEQFPFKVGDSIGVIAQNDPEEVDAILELLGCFGEETRDFLLHKVNLSRVNSSFLKALKAPEENKQLPLLDLLGIYRLDDLSYLTKLMPLLPRLYSIANSSLVFPNEIHLTVSYVSYMLHGRMRKGVGSHFLCHTAKLHSTPIPIYLQPSNHFTLPEDKNASIILVGPGTGIAPFRAFLQERLATSAPGRNWLFFGERNRASDFYYETFWKECVALGRLRLDLAFSRDAEEKVYVQHKMYEERKSLWAWLEEGAYFYLCGDAEEMAKDVDAMLLRIVAEEGAMKEEDARAYVKKLKTEKRYLTDVY